MGKSHNQEHIVTIHTHIHRTLNTVPVPLCAARTSKRVNKHCLKANVAFQISAATLFCWFFLLKTNEFVHTHFRHTPHKYCVSSQNIQQRSVVTATVVFLLFLFHTHTLAKFSHTLKNTCVLSLFRYCRSVNFDFMIKMNYFVLFNFK